MSVLTLLQGTFILAMMRPQPLCASAVYERDEPKQRINIVITSSPFLQSVESRRK